MSLLFRCRSAVLTVERLLTGLAVAIGSLLLVVAVLTGFYQVIARFVLFRPASWSEPLIQSALVWMAYLALAEAMRRGTLISVDILLTVTKDRTRRIIRHAGALAIVLLLGVLLWFGIELCWRVRFQNIAGLNVPASYIYAALPVGSFVSLIALLGHLLDTAPAEPEETAHDTAG